MDELMGYGLIGTIGLSASTIASAIVGDPFPVVVPSIVAAVVIAAHHVRNREAPHQAPDAQLEDGAADAGDARALADGGNDGSGQHDGTGDPLRGDQA